MRRGSLEGSLRGQHSAMLRELGSMRRIARRLAEETVADGWEGQSIEFAHWVLGWVEEFYYRAERLEDQGQLRLRD